MTVPKTYLALSASPNSAPVDVPDSKNGLFAGLLSAALAAPNLTLHDIFTRVQNKVQEASDGAQVPVLSETGAVSSLVLRTDSNASGQADEYGSFEDEWKQWNGIKDKVDKQLFAVYAAKFPEGAFHDAAEARSAATSTQTAGSAISSTPDDAAKPSNSAMKMARLPKREVDPNFEFKQADYELLSECDALDKRFLREGMVLNDPELQDYLDGVGRSLVPSETEPPNVNWHFLVLRDAVPNAFALPNGTVYVDTGLLAVLDNESQLASVLAHELTHVTGRHSYIANRSYRKKALTVTLIQMGASYAPGTLVGASMRLAAAIAPVVMEDLGPGIPARTGARGRPIRLRQAEQRRIQPQRDAKRVPSFAGNERGGAAEALLQRSSEAAGSGSDYVNAYLSSKKIKDASFLRHKPQKYRYKAQRAVRTDVQLAIIANRPRTANAIARRLVEADPASAENVIALADSYRALGPWTTKPEPEELSNHAKKELVRAKAKFTPEEQEQRLRDSAEGQATFAENVKQAVSYYQKALAMDSTQISIYKSLGRAYESVGDVKSAQESYQKYVSLTSDAADAERVKHRLSSLDSDLKPRTAKKGKS